MTQKLTPLRVACAGGQVPLEDDNGAEDAAEGEGSDDDEPKKRKKVVFSDFAFVSKLQTLVTELQNIRTKDKTGKSLALVVVTFVSAGL